MNDEVREKYNVLIFAKRKISPPCAAKEGCPSVAKDGVVTTIQKK
jgi:hypothetical protein